MFTKTLLGLLCVALGYIGGMQAVGHSQPYVGVGIGASNAVLPESSRECGNCIHGEMQTHFPVYQAFMGYDAGPMAFEMGVGTLSHYRTHNIRTTSDIYQEIDTRDSYIRGLFFLSQGDFKPFISAGYATVSMKNHEYGWNDPSMKFVEQINYDKRTRPVYGFGAIYKLNDRLSARAEITYISHVAVSHWTLQQNVTSVWGALVASF